MKYCELTLTWEKGRRLKSASNGSESVTYTYDAFGMRRSKTAGGTETSYVYERGKLIREIRGSEKIDYLYGEDGIIGIKIGSEKYLYRKNIFGDVTEIYNEAGTLVGKYNYNAFGECEIETDEGGIAEKNPIRYRGYYYDEETGFYYLKTRYYDPEIGRFITIDDTSYLDPDSVNGLNLYAYCGNNPVMRIDPTGEMSIFWMETIDGILKDLFMGTGAALIKNSARLFEEAAKLPMYLLDSMGGATFNPAYMQLLRKATNLQYGGTLLNVAGKIANVAGIIFLIAECGISLYNNFTNSNLSTSRKVTDSIVDVSFSLGGFFLAMVAGSAIGSLIPVPILGTIVGTIVGALIGVGIWAFQTFLGDIYNNIKIGFNNFITQTIPNAWNNFINGWNYFWSFDWI